jgi:hypothetical protein
MHYVRSHFRNGTWVRGYLRRSPRRAGLGGMVLAVMVLGVLGSLGFAGGLPTTPSTTTPPAQVPRTIAPERGQTYYIVQVASAVQRAQAETVRAELVRHGHRNAGVLRSDAYRGLRPGYWVTYVGPFKATTRGRTKAEQVQRELPGSLLRVIR